MSQLAARPTGTRSAWKAVAAATAASGSEAGPPTSAIGAAAAARQTAAISVMRAAAAGRPTVWRARLITLSASASPPRPSPGAGRSFDSRSGDSVLRRPARELCAPGDAGLRADVREVALHGARRDVQRRADLLVRPPFGDEAQHLQLADGERSGRRQPVAVRLPAQSAHEMPEQVGADSR